MDKGLGSVTWWGFSPAVDLLEYYQMTKFNNIMTTNSGSSATTAACASHINILLVGSGDIRHILKSIPRLLHKRVSSVHFYILENNLELYARALLLLSLALENPAILGLQEKAELMIEVFGNSLIRPQTASYIQRSANDFVTMVTDFDILNEKLPLFNLDNLKYKERDMLEGIFKLWRKPETDVFDINKCWDLRVRQYLGTRYDAAKGAFDWDYSMKLCDRGGAIIGSRLYQKWRKDGIAFQLREGNYDTPNKTLASGMVFKVDGERLGRRGYWGDIVVSPYISFGVECADEKYFKKANREYVSDAEQITHYNVTSLLHELQTGERYVAAEEPTTAAEPAMATVAEEEEDDEVGSGEKCPEEQKKYMSCDNVKVTFLSLNSLPDMANKSKYQKLFDVVYFSNSMVHHLVPPVADIFADKSMLVLETAKFITELSKEQYIEFANKIDGMAKSLGCETMIDCNPSNDCFAFYKYQRHNA